MQLVNLSKAIKAKIVHVQQITSQSNLMKQINAQNVVPLKKVVQVVYQMESAYLVKLIINLLLISNVLKIHVRIEIVLEIVNHVTIRISYYKVQHV